MNAFICLFFSFINGFIPTRVGVNINSKYYAIETIENTDNDPSQEKKSRFNVKDDQGWRGGLAGIIKHQIHVEYCLFLSNVLALMPLQLFSPLRAKYVSLTEMSLLSRNSSAHNKQHFPWTIIVDRLCAGFLLLPFIELWSHRWGRGQRRSRTPSDIWCGWIHTLNTNAEQLPTVRRDRDQRTVGQFRISGTCSSLRSATSFSQMSTFPRGFWHVSALQGASLNAVWGGGGGAATNHFVQTQRNGIHMGSRWYFMKDLSHSVMWLLMVLKLAFVFRSEWCCVMSQLEEGESRIPKVHCHAK